MPQDLPPSGGGFDPLPYKRNIPQRGPSGAVLLAAVSGIVITGLVLYKRGKGITKELEREKLQARLHLLPLLQAEADRNILAHEARFLRAEAEALRRGLPPALQPIYHDRKNYIPPTFAI